MIAVKSNKLMFFAAMAAGAIVWGAFALFNTEPWDEPYGWLVLAIVAAGFGFLGRGNPLWWPLGIFLGEVLFGTAGVIASMLGYGASGANMFIPLGLMFVVPFTVPAFVGSVVGFGLRKALRLVMQNEE